MRSVICQLCGEIYFTDYENYILIWFERFELFVLSVFCSLFCLSFEDAGAVELGDAVDAPELTWATSGAALWTGQTAVSSDGVDAAVSGVISDDQESVISTTVTGPAILTFKWKVSSEAGYDSFKFLLDGVKQWEITGEVNWAEKTIIIPAGEHTLKWMYVKDSSESAGADKAWLDTVVYNTIKRPINVVATDADTSKIQITWSQVYGATHYRVLRNTSNDLPTATELLAWQGAQNYDDVTASPEIQYYYWVQAAQNDAGLNASSYSDVETGYRLVPADAPVDVKAGENDNTKIRVIWSPVAEATHYRVYRNTSNDVAASTAVTGWQENTVFDDRSSVQGVTYYYWVKASKSAGGAAESVFSGSSKGKRVIPDVDVAENGMGDAWEMTYFESLNHPDGGSLQDADGDGVANIFEYFRGSSPLESDSTPLLKAVKGDQGEYRIRYWRSNTIETRNFRFEWSVDLENWAGDGGGVGGRTVTFSEVALRSESGRTEFEMTLHVEGNSTGLFVRLSSSPISGYALIPAGEFVMGDTFNEGRAYERPTRTVNVSAFYMKKTEVTKAEWDEVAVWANANGYDITAAGGSGKAANHPVQEVTWYECVKWCNAKSEKEGKTPVYTVSGNTFKTGGTYTIPITPVINYAANGYRLPTEAEWEKAARGGLSGKRFPWGDEITHSLANYNSDSSYSYDTSPTRDFHPTYNDGTTPYTSPVGSFAANGYGLYDMSGNVWEWCNDWYGTYAGDTDPTGAASGSYRVIRGGSWNYGAYYCRVADRNINYPSGSFSPSYSGGIRPCIRRF